MKKGHAILVLTAFALLPAFNAPATDAPASRGKLVERLTQALQIKNKNAILNLYDWQGVSENMKFGQEAMIAEMFEQDVKEVKPVALPKDYPLEQTLGGVHFHPNVKVIGLLDITFADENNPLEVKIPYGTRGKAWYLATLIEDKAEAPATNAVSTPH